MKKKPIAKGYRLYYSIEHFRNDKVLEMENRLVVANRAQVGRCWGDNKSMRDTCEEKVTILTVYTKLQAIKYHKSKHT